MSEENDPQGEHSWWCSIPEPLRTRSQWVVTRDKKPIKPESGWNDSGNQFSFQRARHLAEQYGGEPAYVLHADDPYVVIDLDDVGPEEPTKVSEEAGEIVQRLDTYTEASRSGTGLHLVCEGTQLPDRSVKGNLSDRGSIEVYDAGQYVVLTGNQIGPYDTVRDGHRTGDDVEDALSDIQREHLPTRSDTVETATKQSRFDLKSVSRDSVSVRAEDVRRTLEEYAKGGHPEAQRALGRWDSPAGSDGGFPSASEADMALVADLAFWCQEDAPLIDDCFRASNRMREKWDEVHYADGRTYGDGTIQTAVRTNYDTFSGHYVQHR
jgi:primase-polymerase (primpol)-like protein